MKNIFLALLFFSQAALAEDNIFIIIAKKQEEKKKYSWSLTDWLMTKKKIALMDQWLALNSSPDNFEFSLAGYEKKYKLGSATSGVTTVGSTKTLNSGELSAYYKILGLTGVYGHSNEGISFYDARANLRIFGTSAQSTNITGFLGRHHFNNSENFDNWYWGGSAAIYLLPFLGVDASYKRFLSSENGNNSKLQGQNFEPGVFLDVFMLRLSASYDKEVLDWERNNSGTPTTTRETRKGWKYGLKIFF